MFLLIEYLHSKLNYLGYISTNDKLICITLKLLYITNYTIYKFHYIRLNNNNTTLNYYSRQIRYEPEIKQ